MNAYLKRTSLLFTLIAVYLVSFKTAPILDRVSTDIAEAKHKKDAKQDTELRAEQAVELVKTANKARSTSTAAEPYKNRWQRRFANTTQGYFFFKHIRKAGGTTLRSYFREVFLYHGITHNTRDDYLHLRQGKTNETSDVLYVEHEFQTMDADCASVDDRWNNALTVITLRHPIERHMSEYFFSGTGTQFPIDRTQLYTNKTYTHQLSKFLTETIPEWIEKEGGGPQFRKKYGEYDRRFNMYFGRYYRNNFQLRALAGCSSEKCMDRRLGNVDRKVGNSTVTKEIHRLHPSYNDTLYVTPEPLCTQYFHKTNVLFDPCAKSRYKKEPCELGCDGPCFYPSVAWGPLDESDVTRALHALEKFDLVLFLESFNDPDQAAYVADVLGVPRDAEFALSNHDASYVRVQKTNKRDKTYFYRDLLKELSPKSLEMLTKENALEIYFYEKAMEVNKRKTNEWKLETGWEPK